KNYPKKVPLNIDIPDITLKDMLKESTKTFANKKALSCHGEKLNFSEIDSYADKFAGFLQIKWKLRKGDHIAIMLPNLLQFPI
ncbi:AMP-binding protein, partial [Francisella tularensis subsp. holarctica]|uniref:AMP-binding protein n=1 Tax=Francisella tularensis TaxID=263 RepID=UPI002381ACD2